MMLVISIAIVAFGAIGFIVSLYLRFTVTSPILKTEDGKNVEASGLSLQQIINLIFTYFAILHLIIALAGVNFLLIST